MYIDSHCHLHMLKLDNYSGDLSALVDQASSVGVEHILCVGTTLEDSKVAIRIAEQFAHITASVGIHPSEKPEIEPTTDILAELASHPKVVAIGETGLDYHYNDSGLDVMRERFRTHISVAKQLQKPLIIHSRDAREDTMNILREEDAKSVGGVMHCFTESWEMAQEALAIDFYISISGIVTFKKAGNVAIVAEKTPLEKVLIETDAPFLAPVPFRGKQNEPQYVCFVAEKIAELKGLSVEEVAKVTTENFKRLFCLTT